MVLIILFFLASSFNPVSAGLCDDAIKIVSSKIGETVILNRCISTYRNFDSESNCTFLDIKTNPDGSFSFLTICGQKSFWLKVTYLFEREVPIATDYIKKGDIIAHRVKFEKRMLQPKDFFYIPDVKAIERAVALKDIPKGSLVTTKHIKLPYAVKRGELVKVIYRSDSLEVVLAAIAKTSGNVGDEVKVVNPTSGIVFACKVVGVKEVEVFE